MATYYRAKEAIIHHVAQFCLSRYISGAPVNIAGPDRSFHSGGNPPVGTLVALCSVVLPSKWAFSWYRGWSHHRRVGSGYLLESIEDRAQCVWANCELRWLPLETVALHPEWQWTDAQFVHNDRWQRQGRKGSHTFTPRQMRWINGGKTPVLVVGKRFSDEVVTRTIHDRKKLSATAMRSFLQEASENWDVLRAGELLRNEHSTD